jgi:phytoene dehydrogenase-like protein
MRSAEGNPNHLDLSLDQMLGWRPPGVVGSATDLPWLHLAGAGTHPGGGLSGVSGRRAAETLLGGARARTRARGGRVGTEVSSLVAGLRFYLAMRRSGR